jgi:hypothetical protein
MGKDRRLSSRPLLISVLQQVTGKAHRQCFLAYARRAAEHDGMGQTVLVCHLHQTLLGFLLSYYLSELQFFSSFPLLLYIFIPFHFFTELHQSHEYMK